MKKKSRGLGQPPKNVKRFYVPMDKWQKFQCFMDLYSHIEKNLEDLAEDWSSHVNFLIEELHLSDDDLESLESIQDTIKNLTELIVWCDKPQKKKYNWKRDHTVPGPVKGAVVAEVIIEEIATINGEL